MLSFSCSTQRESTFWCAFRWVSPFTTSTTSVLSYLSSRISVAKHLSQSSPKAHLWLGCEACLPLHQISLDCNIQADKVGWSNQTIPCFLLSSSTLFQSWKGSLYPGWCHIWCCSCQTLITFAGWCACSCQTWAILSLASWWLLAF